ncbi:MAG: hypothetical protein M1826_001111 [Phylliscum demangeonii]|nr:MAG: hypothetical protein M1826_001111 [Phylliscum demangeonii]
MHRVLCAALDLGDGQILVRLHRRLFDADFAFALAALQTATDRELVALAVRTRVGLNRHGRSLDIVVEGLGPGALLAFPAYIHMDQDARLPQSCPAANEDTAVFATSLWRPCALACKAYERDEPFRLRARLTEHGRALQLMHGTFEPENAELQRFRAERAALRGLIASPDSRSLRTWLQITRYAREVIQTQESRRFVLGMTLSGSTMRLWEFDRLGATTSRAFNIHEDARWVVEVILSFLLGRPGRHRRSGASWGSSRDLWNVPRFNGDQLRLSLKIHPHYTTERRAELEAAPIPKHWQWVAALHRDAPDPGDVDTATPEWTWRRGLDPEAWEWIHPHQAALELRLATPAHLELAEEVLRASGVLRANRGNEEIDATAPA